MRRRLLVTITILLVVIAAGAGAWMQAERAAVIKRGQALYGGQAALAGRLAGHELDLPTVATRCANCHESGGPGPAPRGDLPYAAVLGAQALTLPRVRRGGPPSAYDAHALCRLLRTGLDPAQVMVDTNMPRYRPTDEQCEDLWKFLINR